VQDAERFPEHLGRAAEAFIDSAFVIQAFGEAVATQYGLTARYEWSRFLDAVTDWELDRYFELI
jgi:glutamine synthetase